jgi:hypothetical protein
MIVAGAIAMCRGEFGVPDDGISTAVWLGDGPETVYESHLNRFNIYLGRDSNQRQIRYSGSHEAFHRVCSPGVGAHWADEMFAVLFSLLYLDHTGFQDHADLNRTGLASEARACSAKAMFAIGGGRLPDGLYGRVYRLGTSLIDRIGWESLKTLAVTKRADGRMDVGAWLTSLAPEERTLVRSLMRNAPEIKRGASSN